MEQQLEEVQSYFTDEGFREHIDDVLSNYLEKGPCQFTPYQKNALPICAAYFAVQAQQGEGQQVSLMELRNRFFKKAEFDDLLVTAHEFAQRLRGDGLAEQISTRLESLKRNYRLFTKLLAVFDHFCQPYEKIQCQKVSWLLFLLAKEHLSKDHEDIEKCAYLLHYICTAAVKRIVLAQNQGDSVGEDERESETTSTISDQVNNLLLKGKLEAHKMAEFQGEFSATLEELVANMTKKNPPHDKQTEGTSPSEAASTQISKINGTDENTSTENDNELISIDSVKTLLSLIPSLDSTAQLLKVLEKHCRTHEQLKDEQDFLLREEFLTNMLSTPKPSNRSNNSNNLQPPGITLDHQEAKYAANHQLDNNEKKVPRRNLIFSDEGTNVHLNSRLSDIDKPAASPLPPNQLGLFQQPMMPKTPHPDNQLFKMPYARGAQQQQQQQQQQLSMNLLLPPSTPYSTALDNFKWINMYSKSDSTRRIDELMARIDREYKGKILAHIQDVSREVFFNSKKKNDTGAPFSSPAQNDVENKVAKTAYLFLNVLERMIMEEDQRNCKESQLIQLLENKNFVSALLANCIMTMCFVREIKGITLDLLLKECQITSLDFWRVISNFAKFDKHMPEAIRENLFNLERQILLYNIWEEKDEFIQSALESFQTESTTKNQNYDKVLCRRLISHSATRVKEICRVLNLNEEIQERVWDALLFIFRHQISLMTRHYIDQILICSIYALKLIRSELFKDLDIKFRSMLTACESLPNFYPEKVKKMKSETGEVIDIITFYNKVYLQPMKVYFKHSCTLPVPVSSSIGSNHLPGNYASPQKAQGIFASSLNDSIPPNFINYTPLLKDNKAAKLAATPVTPTTQRLQAHQEILEPQLQNLRQSSQFRRSGSNTSNPVHLKTLAVLGQMTAADQTNANSGRNSTQGVSFEGQGGRGNSSKQPAANNSFQKQNVTPTNKEAAKFAQKQTPNNVNTSPKFGSNPISRIGNRIDDEIGRGIDDNNLTLQQQQQMLASGMFGIGISNPNFDSDEETQEKCQKKLKVDQKQANGNGDGYENKQHLSKDDDPQRRKEERSAQMEDHQMND